MTADSSTLPMASGVRSLLIGGAALSAVVALGVATTTLFRSWPFPVSAPGGAHSAIPAANPGLGLRAEIRGSNLQVTWNHEADSVRNATSGSLTFQDGESVGTLQLNQTAARAGSVFYAAKSQQIQVALTIIAPDHVVSESISATMPAAAGEPAASTYPEVSSEEPVSGRDREGSLRSPEAGRQTKAGPTSGIAKSARVSERDRASRSIPRNQRAAAGEPSQPASTQEKPAATGASVAQPPAPGSPRALEPVTISIRVAVDETGRVVEAALVTDNNLDPAFAEAALQMARGWQFEAQPGTQRTTRVLQFRQAANR